MKVLLMKTVGWKPFGWKYFRGKCFVLAPIKEIAAVPSLLNWLQVSEGAQQETARYILWPITVLYLRPDHLGGRPKNWLESKDKSTLEESALDESALEESALDESALEEGGWVKVLLRKALCVSAYKRDSCCALFTQMATSLKRSNTSSEETARYILRPITDVALPGSQ
jgi:hypothetical protein